MQHAVLDQLEHGSEENKGKSRGQISPDPRQLDAGNDDDQGIQKVKRGINAAGDVKQRGGEGDIGEDLQTDVRPRVVPQSQQKNLEERNGIPEDNNADESKARDIGLRELGNRQLNAQQEGNNNDAYLPHPIQPSAIIQFILHQLLLLLRYHRQLLGRDPENAFL